MVFGVRSGFGGLFEEHKNATLLLDAPAWCVVSLVVCFAVSAVEPVAQSNSPTDSILVLAQYFHAPHHVILRQRNWSRWGRFHGPHLRLSRTMHEIVTLQLGQRSNYVATHFWNLQVIRYTHLITS